MSAQVPPVPCRRGTSNSNVRGSSYNRAVRRAWLLTTFGDGEKAPCYRCGRLLDDSTVTADRIVPGRDGGRYTRDNIRPACGRCNSETGGAMAVHTTAEQRSRKARASRDKGAAFERRAAVAIQPWWPAARRSRDNGSINSADTGDLAGTDERLWWSLKDDAKGDLGTPKIIEGWMTEARAKAGTERLPLLVQKRRGHADPLRSWCWLALGDLVRLTDMSRRAVPITSNDWPRTDFVRCEFRTVLDLLVVADFATAPTFARTGS